MVALATFAPLLRGRRVLLFVDSVAVGGALVKGYSSVEDFCELVGQFWQLALDLDILIYIDRVSTDANVSDGVSRLDETHARACGWVPWSVVWEGAGGQGLGEGPSAH